MDDAELETFKSEIDLRLFAAAHSYDLDRKESWAGSAVMRHPNNDKIIIKRDADGHYVYFSVRDDADNGTILDFVRRRLNCSLGAARKELRAFMGRPAPILAPYPPLLKVIKDRIRVERAYTRMEVALSHPYLENERKIPCALLRSRRFAARIRIDAHKNAVFAHFDSNGLCGFELKNSSFTSFAAGGSKGLFTSHIESGDNRIVFCESGIDALSFAALFPEPHTRYGSLGGKPTPAQKELIRAATATMPATSTVIAAMDSDTAGREMAEIVREAVSLAGRSDLRFEIQEPEGWKDWNDQLRAKPKLSLSFRPEGPSVA